MKTGAISESTTVLNVDKKNKTPSDAIQPHVPLGNRVGAINSQDQPLTVTMSLDTTASTAGATTVIKKEGCWGSVSVAAKCQAPDKKKMDARKKSLKRL